MKKSKLENFLSPSSSWRENPYPSRKAPKSTATNPASADKCLPGFFHFLVSTFHFPSSRRKSLTFGSKKREQRISVSTYPAEANEDFGSGRGDARTVTVPDSDGRPQASAGETTTTATRLNLVGALEKCDRDLAELQKTIDVIKSTFHLHQKQSIPPPAAAPEHIKPFKSVTGDEVVCQQAHNQRTNITSTEEPQSHTESKYTDKDTNTMIVRADKNIKPNITNLNIVKLNCNNVRRNIIITRRSSSPLLSPGAWGVVRTVSRSMVESVNQVCDDVASGEKREVGRIGLSLQDHICRDLIDETIRELSSPAASLSPSSPSCLSSGRRHRRRASGSLPLDACRRRLVF